MISDIPFGYEGKILKCSNCQDEIQEGTMCLDCQRLARKDACLWADSSTDADTGEMKAPDFCEGRDCLKCKFFTES